MEEEEEEISLSLALQVRFSLIYLHTKETNHFTPYPCHSLALSLPSSLLPQFPCNYSTLSLFLYRMFLI